MNPAGNTKTTTRRRRRRRSTTTTSKTKTKTSPYFSSSSSSAKKPRHSTDKKTPPKTPPTTTASGGEKNKEEGREESIVSSCCNKSCTSNSLSNSSSSSYFLRSPSSVRGSIDSLDRLWYTWYNNNGNNNNEDNDFDFDVVTGTDYCQLRKQRQRNNNNNEKRSSKEEKSNATTTTILFPCTSCKDVISNIILSQFSICPIFQQRLEKIIKEGINNELSLRLQCINHTNNSCIDTIGILLENELTRHLCPHGCYLRAFAPNREWYTLRSTIHKKTDESVGTLLKDWTCKLIPAVDDNHNNNNNNLPRIVFINRNNDMICDNIPKVLRALGLNKTKQQQRQQQAQTQDEDNDANTNNNCTIIPTPTSSSSSLSSSSSPIPTVKRERCMMVTPSPTPTLTKSSNTAAAATKVLSLKEQNPRRTITRNASQSTSSSSSLLLYTSIGSSTSSPRSPLGLLEELFWNDPWKLLLSTIFLNRTRRIQVDIVMYKFLQIWPTPQCVLMKIDDKDKDDDDDDDVVDKISNVINPLGLANKRASGIRRFSQEYLDLMNIINNDNDKKQQENNSSSSSLKMTRTEVTSLYFCGSYAADAYQIFILQDWINVNPTDHALKAYVEWKRSL